MIAWSDVCRLGLIFLLLAALALVPVHRHAYRQGYVAGTMDEVQRQIRALQQEVTELEQQVREQGAPLRPVI